jgi:hypothetical protein
MHASSLMNPGDLHPHDTLPPLKKRKKTQVFSKASMTSATFLPLKKEKPQVFSEALITTATSQILPPSLPY